MTLVPTNTTPAPTNGHLTLRGELDLWKDAFELAQTIAGTPFVPTAIRNNPPAVMATILRGAELGVSALHSLAQIDFIEGRPSLRAELARALVVAQGHRIWPEQMTNTRVVLCGQRSGDPEVVRVTWTLDDAKNANLDRKQNWRQYPRQMLTARATAELCRLLFADVIAGMPFAEEDDTDTTAGDTTDTPPDTPPAQTRTAPAATARRGARKPRQQPAPAGPPPLPPLPGEPAVDGVAVETDNPNAVNTPDVDDFAEVGADDEPDDLAMTADEFRATRMNGVPATIVSDPEHAVEPAQAIAIRARRAGLDHHHIVAAVTHGDTTSAKGLPDTIVRQVLDAIQAIGDGTFVLTGDDETGWHLEGTVEHITRRLDRLDRDTARDAWKAARLPRPDTLPTHGRQTVDAARALLDTLEDDSR